MAFHDTEPSPSPSPSPSPEPSPVTLEYGIVWTLKKGNAIYKCVGGITGDNYVDMSRDDNGIPQIPTCDSGANDDRDPGAGEVIDPQSFFHTEYKWNNVKIGYSYNGTGSPLLDGFEIEARVYSLTMTPAPPDGGSDEPSRAFKDWVPFRVKSATIYSEDPNDGNTWVYDNPRNYGGIIVFTDDTPVDKEYNTKFICGIQESAYNYVDVFDQVKFGYIPRNTYENKEMDASESFQSQPLYPDVKDAEGLAAPIYPMNAITAFVPDPRESVTVTYRVKLDVVALNDKGEEIETKIENPEVSIKQTVEQDTSNYGDQLEELNQLCQFSNPGGWKTDELSPNYNYDYPYTMVAGFDGVPENGDIETRGEDKNNDPLQRGDVIYIPNTDKRLTWNIGDIPERLSVINGGTGYKGARRSVTIKAFETDRSFDDERYPNGRPPRCYDVKTQLVPSGLLVDIETEDGQVVSASISEDSSPTGWVDGDVIRVVGGNNNAEIRIHIDNPPGWTEKFINKY